MKRGGMMVGFGAFRVFFFPRCNPPWGGSLPLVVVYMCCYDLDQVRDPPCSIVGLWTLVGLKGNGRACGSK